jgi:hypothetical protein
MIFIHKSTKIVNKIEYHEIILEGVEDSLTSLYAANALSGQLANQLGTYLNKLVQYTSH